MSSLHSGRKSSKPSKGGQGASAPPSRKKRPGMTNKEKATLFVKALTADICQDYKTLDVGASKILHAAELPISKYILLKELFPDERWVEKLPIECQRMEPWVCPQVPVLVDGPTKKSKDPETEMKSKFGLVLARKFNFNKETKIEFNMENCQGWPFLDVVAWMMNQAGIDANTIAAVIRGLNQVLCGTAKRSKAQIVQACGGTPKDFCRIETDPKDKEGDVITSPFTYPVVPKKYIREFMRILFDAVSSLEMRGQLPAAEPGKFVESKSEPERTYACRANLDRLMAQFFKVKSWQNLYAAFRAYLAANKKTPGFKQPVELINDEYYFSRMPGKPRTKAEPKEKKTDGGSSRFKFSLPVDTETVESINHTCKFSRYSMNQAVVLSAMDIAIKQSSEDPTPDAHLRALFALLDAMIRDGKPDCDPSTPFGMLDALKELQDKVGKSFWNEEWKHFRNKKIEAMNFQRQFMTHARILTSRDTPAATGTDSKTAKPMTFEVDIPTPDEDEEHGDDEDSKQASRKKGTDSESGDESEEEGSSESSESEEEGSSESSDEDAHKHTKSSKADERKQAPDPKAGKQSPKPKDTRESEEEYESEAPKKRKPPVSASRPSKDATKEVKHSKTASKSDTALDVSRPVAAAAKVGTGVAKSATPVDPGPITLSDDENSEYEVSDREEVNKEAVLAPLELKAKELHKGVKTYKHLETVFPTHFKHLRDSPKFYAASTENVQKMSEQEFSAVVDRITESTSRREKMFAEIKKHHDEVFLPNHCRELRDECATYFRNIQEKADRRAGEPWAHRLEELNVEYTEGDEYLTKGDLFNAYLHLKNVYNELAKVQIPASKPSSPEPTAAASSAPAVEQSPKKAFSTARKALRHLMSGISDTHKTLGFDDTPRLQYLVDLHKIVYVQDEGMERFVKEKHSKDSYIREVAMRETICRILQDVYNEFCDDQSQFYYDTQNVRPNMIKNDMESKLTELNEQLGVVTSIAQIASKTQPKDIEFVRDAGRYLDMLKALRVNVRTTLNCPTNQEMRASYKCFMNDIYTFMIVRLQVRIWSSMYCDRISQVDTSRFDDSGSAVALLRSFRQENEESADPVPASPPKAKKASPLKSASSASASSGKELAVAAGPLEAEPPGFGEEFDWGLGSFDPPASYLKGVASASSASRKQSASKADLVAVEPARFGTALAPKADSSSKMHAAAASAPLKGSVSKTAPLDVDSSETHAAAAPGPFVRGFTLAQVTTDTVAEYYDWCDEVIEAKTQETGISDRDFRSPTLNSDNAPELVAEFLNLSKVNQDTGKAFISEYMAPSKLYFKHKEIPLSQLHQYWIMNAMYLSETALKKATEAAPAAPKKAAEASPKKAAPAAPKKAAEVAEASPKKATKAAPAAPAKSTEVAPAASVTATKAVPAAAKADPKKAAPKKADPKKATKSTSKKPSKSGTKSKRAAESSDSDEDTPLADLKAPAAKKPRKAPSADTDKASKRKPSSDSRKESKPAKRSKKESSEEEEAAVSDGSI